MEKRYRFTTFLFDAFMTMITGGLWLIYLFLRHIRTR